MARITAIALRDRARAALLSAGGRGFVRFPERGALLLSDAIRRCGDEAEKTRLLAALAEAGFEVCEQENLLMITPSDALLWQIDCEGGCEIDWDGSLCPVQALCARWIKRPQEPLTQDGRQMIVDTLRLTWQGRVTDGLAALCAQAAVMQRKGDTSGLRIAGAVLKDWCDLQEGKAHED